mmetsp:Transcript_105731/g.166911  ORF Transcript_105731/g.166911 Transcript_105731/m.166911 type:complete len:372 (+) Transcript_105731:18-1133(+)
MRYTSKKKKIDVCSRMTMAFAGDMQATEEIRLEPELINSLYRRRQRRLRDIQNNCKVNVWLDKLRGVLHVSGSKACVADAKKQIVGLSGPRKVVAAAVWAELLRTRKLHSGDEAAVARIQLESGCRIHVERSSQEVHLFGDSESVAKAEQLLNELDQNCVEEVVPMNVEPVQSEVWEAIANSCGVTLRMEKGYACILGLRDSVRKAVSHLQDQIEDMEFQSELSGPLMTHVGELKNTDKATEIVSGTPKAQPKTQKSVVRNQCPTCGACPFCASCGHPIAAFDGHTQGFISDGVGNVSFHTHANTMYVKMDSNMTAASGMWQQMPFMPYDGGTTGSDCTTQMAFMMPSPMVQNGQNAQVCFVPATMMAAQQ